MAGVQIQSHTSCCSHGGRRKKSRVNPSLAPGNFVQHSLSKLKAVCPRLTVSCKRLGLPMRLCPRCPRNNQRIPQLQLATVKSAKKGGSFLFVHILPSSVKQMAHTHTHSTKKHITAALNPGHTLPLHTISAYIITHQRKRRPFSHNPHDITQTPPKKEWASIRNKLL